MRRSFQLFRTFVSSKLNLNRASFRRKQIQNSLGLQVMTLEDRIVPAIILEQEPNNDIATAQAVSVPTGDILTTTPDQWLDVQGNLNSGGDSDYFQFTLNSYSGVFLDIDSRETGASASLDSVLTLLDQAGNTLDTNDDGYDFDTGFPAPSVDLGTGNGIDSSLYRELVPGTYLVKVSSFNTTSGDYHLRILADNFFPSTAPSFSSNPSASDTLFLDLGGYSATDAWGTYSALPFDFNGSNSIFSPSERLAIRNIWKTTSEDYSPFNVNVTTVNPGSFNDTVAFHQVITMSSPTIVNEATDTLGISYYDSYATGGATDNVGFVFAGNFGDYAGADSGISAWTGSRAEEIGSIASHEFGHSLGLRHTTTTPQTSIMNDLNLGISRKLWSRGNAHDPNDGDRFQDDIAVIGSSTNTFGFRADDYGNSIANASMMSGSNGVYYAAGIIGDPSTADVDFFRFDVAGPAHVTMFGNVDELVANLDVVLKLYDSSGNLVATSAPGNSLDASIDRNLSVGTYYLAVSSDGETGEVGQYTVSANVALQPNTPPVNNVPGAQNAAEDTNLVFSAAKGNQISISDADAGNSNMIVTLDASNGKLTLSGTSGLTFFAGDGTDDSIVQFSGTMSSINKALNGMKFLPTSNYSGAANLTLTTSDLGNSGSGGIMIDTDVIPINVAAINDAPKNSLPLSPMIGDPNADLAIPGIFVTDPDAGDSMLSVYFSVSHGVIFATSNTSHGVPQNQILNSGTNFVKMSGTLDQINITLADQHGLVFRPDPGFVGNTYLHVTTKDGGASGDGGELTANDVLTLTFNEPESLIIHGTSKNDVIKIHKAGSSTTDVTVEVNGVTGGPRRPNGPIMIAGYDGNDQIIIDDNVTLPSIVFGGQGDDTLTGGGGKDVFDGGAGNDVITGRGDNDLIFGGTGNDKLDGSDGDDAIDGMAGNDVIFGGAGNDLIFGVAGNDSIDGGVGNDSIDGGLDNDNIYGSAGDDLAFGGDGDDVIDLGSGNDAADAGAGNDRVIGGDGNDLVFGSLGNDTVDGGAGLDSIDGNAGNDSIFGSADGDWIFGSEGDDTLDGGDATDTLVGGSGNNSLFNV